MIEFNKIYDLLNIKFDSIKGEAFYSDKMQEVIDILDKKGKLINSEGAQIVDLKEAGIDEKEFLEKVDELADKAFSDQCTSTNPRVPLIQEIKQILLDSYYGKEIE